MFEHIHNLLKKRDCSREMRPHLMVVAGRMAIVSELVSSDSDAPSYLLSEEELTQLVRFLREQKANSIIFCGQGDWKQLQVDIEPFVGGQTVALELTTAWNGSLKALYWRADLLQAAQALHQQQQSERQLQPA